MREQTRDRRLARAWRTPQNERSQGAAANETRQGAIWTQKMILSDDLVETFWTKSIRARARRVRVEFRCFEEIWHRMCPACALFMEDLH
jgi:hypothetical protein